MKVITRLVVAFERIADALEQANEIELTKCGYPDVVVDRIKRSTRVHR